MSNPKRSLFIYGAGLLGQQVLHHLRAYYSETVQVMGFIDDVQPPGVDVVDGYKTLGSLADAQANTLLTPDAAQAVFAIGYASLAARRAALDRLCAVGYTLFSVVHPAAIVEPGARIGAGSVVLGGAILDQQVAIGEACYIDIGVRLGAGTQVGRNTYLSSGTSTGSRVTIGCDSFFGMDCTVTTDVKIGDRVFVNAKSLIARDTPGGIKLVELHKSKQLPLPESA